VVHTPRIEELRRRVERDPASIAFAQLAEEHRRLGEFDEAVRICRTGLASHPAYLSARVTLGRALVELEQADEAKTELEYVLRVAPDNLAAIRALAEIRQRGGPPVEAPRPGSALLAFAPHDLVEGAQAADFDFDLALRLLDSVGLDSPNALNHTTDGQDVDDGAPLPDPALAELEWWLEAILADRLARARA
jgi:tetratricopeptide (TPR) repeat protein